jgi:hypothetical protein
LRVAARISVSIVFLALLLGAVVVVSETALASTNGALPARTIDLASGRLGGSTILGRTVAGVTAALGRPDQRIHGVARYTLRYEPPSSQRASWGVQILFRRDGGALRAWSIVITDPTFREPRIGRLLQLAPSSLQKAVIADYGDRYSVLRPYRCTSKPRQCRGELAPSGAGRLHLGIGSLLPSRQAYLVLYR